MVGVVGKAVAVAAAMAQCGWCDRVEVGRTCKQRIGATATYLVASCGHPEAVDLLVRVGADT